MGPTAQGISRVSAGNVVCTSQVLHRSGRASQGVSRAIQGVSRAIQGVSRAIQGVRASQGMRSHTMHMVGSDNTRQRDGQAYKDVHIAVWSPVSNTATA